MTYITFRIIMYNKGFAHGEVLIINKSSNNNIDNNEADGAMFLSTPIDLDGEIIISSSLVPGA